MHHSLRQQARIVEPRRRKLLHVERITADRKTYDVVSDVVIRSVHVAGTLTFARDRNTKLCVGLVKIQPGEDASEHGFDCDLHPQTPDPTKPKPALEIGTAADPIPARFTATVRLDTPNEVTYFDNGGILQTVLRNLKSS